MIKPWCVCMCSLSRVQLFATPWTGAHQVPLSIKFSRQEYWSGHHFLCQEIFPTQGSNLCFLHCRQILYAEPPGKSQALDIDTVNATRAAPHP